MPATFTVRDESLEVEQGDRSSAKLNRQGAKNTAAARIAQEPMIVASL